MKKITQEELDNMQIKPTGKSSYLRSVFMNLKVNEMILVEPKDWHWKYKTPSSLCRRIEENTKFKFECMTALDGSGWVIKRLA